MSPIARNSGAALALLFVSGTAFCSEPPPLPIARAAVTAMSVTSVSAPPIDLSEALSRALRDNPGLQRFPLERRAAEARKLQAGRRPNPSLELDVENFAGSGEYRGADGLETTLRFGQLLERNSKREARTILAENGLLRADSDFALARLDVLVETTRRFIDVVETQQQLALAERGVDLAKQVLQDAQRRVNAGAASTLEQHRAQIALSRAELEVEHYEHLLLTQRRWLASQWGEKEETFLKAEADLLALPEVADDETLQTRLLRSPDYLQYDIERRLRDSEVILARAQASVDPTVSAGLRRFERSQDIALIATLSVPLTVRDRNQGNIAAATALRDSVEYSQQNALLQAQTALYDLSQELRHARTLVDTLRNELIPEAEAALKLTLRGYANGRYSQLEVLDARSTALELQRELLINAADYHRVLAAIERMTALAPDETP